MSGTTHETNDQVPTFVCTEATCREWMFAVGYPDTIGPPACPVNEDHGVMRFDGRDFEHMDPESWPHPYLGKISDQAP
jgi:hypothetical protein